MAILIFSCAIPEDTKKEDSEDNATVLSNVVLYNGVMNDTTNLLFQKTTYGFPNSIIQVKFEFSDPEIFDGTYLVEVNTGTNAYTIISHAPTFTITHNIDLTNSLYFRVSDSSWETDVEYDGRDINLKITWIRE
jgi:hypothetical protein